MFKVKTLNTISTNGLDLFPRELYEISSDVVPQPDAILVRSQSMHDFQIDNSVKLIGRAGAGVNNIPIDILTERGIPVFNTPGANANAVRELVLAGMLLACRNICQAWHYINQLEIDEADYHKEIEQNKKRFVGSELFGKTLGVIGLGSVGVKVANAAINLGMHVIGYDPTITVNRAWELSADVKCAHSMEEVVPRADFLTFHVPLNDATKALMNKDRLALLKTNAVILNFARDGIIDKKALTEILNKDKALTYVTDFPNRELKKHPRVIGLPHLGASTREAEENCATMIVQQTRQFLENGSIINSVNFPHVALQPLKSGRRLAIVNANIPNMVAQISATLANESLNIVSLVNQSRDKIAYTVIDLNNEINNQICQQIAAIQGVKQVRIIYPNTMDH